LRAHCQTSGWSLAAEDALNNIARTTIEAMAATQGGTQSLHTNGFDEAIALPTDLSADLARDTQILLQQESGTTRLIDPWGGSYYVEKLTAELAAKAWRHIEEIERLGGMTKAIEAGIPKRRIAEQAARTQGLIDSGRQAVIGVNRYRQEESAAIEARKIDNSAVLAAQKDKLRRLRAGRDAAAVGAALAALTVSAKMGSAKMGSAKMGAARGGGDNLLALAVAAVRVHATVGEISAALEVAWGRHRAETGLTPDIYSAHLDTAAFAAVRNRVTAFAQNAGRAPRILIAKLGQDGHDRGQNVVASAFLDFGFEVIAGLLFAAPDAVARQAAEANVDIVGVSSLAAGHLTMLPALKRALARLDRADILLVAGGTIPPQDYAALAAAGVAAIFPPGVPLPQAALTLLDQLEAHLGFTQKEPDAYL
jgi:methylmalonyl-CoA mutase